MTVCEVLYCELYSNRFAELSVIGLVLGSTFYLFCTIIGLVLVKAIPKGFVIVLKWVVYRYIHILIDALYENYYY